MPRTPAMITGIVIGYSSTGSSTSRLRARTSIAAKSVPTAAKPDRAGREQAEQSGPGARRAAPGTSARRAARRSARRPPAASGRPTACRRRAPAGRSAPSSARAASRSAARARTCARAPACPENAIAIHRMPAAASSTGLPSRTKPNANTSTQDTAKNSVVYRISRLRTSMRRSLRVTSQTVCEEGHGAGAPCRLATTSRRLAIPLAQTSPAPASIGTSRPFRSMTARSSSPSMVSRSCVVTSTIAPGVLQLRQPRAAAPPSPRRPAR